MDFDIALNTLENCRFCLMCRHVAPVGHVTSQEALTPHGIALAITSQQRGVIDWTDDAVGLVFSEVDGGNSRAHCVTDQPFEEAVAATRAHLVAEGHAPQAVLQLREQWQNGAMPTAQAEQGEVALFVGEDGAARPEMLAAVMKLLDGIGIRPIPLASAKPNGLVAASMGLTDIAQQQASAILQDLKASGAKRLLVLSAGDYYAFSQAYAERLGVNWPSEVEIVEVMQVLADAELPLQVSAESIHYAYIDPTHAVRIPERHAYPRGLLTATLTTDPLELFWRKDRAHPVGSTAVRYTQPAIAEKLTRARLEDAKNSGAAILFCEDAATLTQLESYAEEYALRVRDLYQWLAEHIQ